MFCHSTEGPGSLINLSKSSRNPRISFSVADLATIINMEKFSDYIMNCRNKYM